MSTQTTVRHGVAANGHPVPSKTENFLIETTKPFLQSILQTETAAAFTKKPSSTYQIEFTPSIYNPEAINSMATSSSHATTFTPTRPTIRPMSMKTTIKTSMSPTSSTSASPIIQEQKHYVHPEIQASWPVYNLIIEGHSKVKTYGLKNDDDEIANNLPKIRPVKANENPVVDRITNEEDGPEFNAKHKKATKKTDDGKKSAMTSLLSLLDGSFGNLLSDDSVDEVRHGSEKKRKTRRSIPDDNNQQERVFSVSFQVDDGSEANEPVPMYREGTVIEEKLWPFQPADKSR
jgi:hypothetical protein